MVVFWYPTQITCFHQSGTRPDYLTLACSGIWVLINFTSEGASLPACQSHSFIYELTMESNVKEFCSPSTYMRYMIVILHGHCPLQAKSLG